MKFPSASLDTLEQLERLFIRVSQKDIIPVADAHRAELDRRHMNTRIRAQLRVDRKRGGGLGRGGEDALTCRSRA